MNYGKQLLLFTCILFSSLFIKNVLADAESPHIKKISFIDLSSSPKAFLIYDELLGLKERPGSFQFEQIHVVYMWAAWGGSTLNTGTGNVNDKRPVKNYSDLPPLDYLSNNGYLDDAGMQQQGGYGDTAGLTKDYNGLIAVDFESWPRFDSKDFKAAKQGALTVPSKTMLETMEKISMTINVLKEAYPNAKIGWYDLTGGYPVSGFPNVNDQTLAAWEKINDLYADIIEKIDVLMPSLYVSRTRGDRKTRLSFDDYLKKIEMIIAEQRRLAPNKPVIAFVSPHIMDEYPQLLPLNEWETAIEQYKALLDGVVLWSKHKPKFSHAEMKPYIDLLR
ncbi:MAG: hypothetical protein CSA20_00740 [Deltaproteobacteria bacterium]|nr:MAG: hypothetical protein CSA20_00740 [Deltaproteobacteria bacterium]